MGRAYNVSMPTPRPRAAKSVENYIDPAFPRIAPPRLFIDEDGKERLRIDGRKFGGRRGSWHARRNRRP